MICIPKVSVGSISQWALSPAEASFCFWHNILMSTGQLHEDMAIQPPLNGIHYLSDSNLNALLLQSAPASAQHNHLVNCASRNKDFPFWELLSLTAIYNQLHSYLFFFPLSIHKHVGFWPLLFPIYIFSRVHLPWGTMQVRFLPPLWALEWTL